MSEENQGGSSLGSMQDVGRIREIIFGSQMRDYEQHFRLLERDLEGLKDELEALREQSSKQDKELDKKLCATTCASRTMTCAPRCARPSIA